MYKNANLKLKDRARDLRKARNYAEVHFWRYIKNRQFKGFSFDRQSIIGNYIADFYCAKRKVVIEIDGSSHDGKEGYDAKRDEYMRGLGLTIIRIQALDVLYNLDYVLRDLENHAAFK